LGTATKLFFATSKIVACVCSDEGVDLYTEDLASNLGSATCYPEYQSLHANPS
jgi:hypothetical protein